MALYPLLKLFLIPMSDKNIPFPFHAFKVQGEYFFLDVATNRFYNINKGLYQFLHLSEKEGTDYQTSLQKYIYKQGNVFEDEQKQAIDTAKALAENGLWTNINKTAAVGRKSNKRLLATLSKSAADRIDSLYLMLAETCNLKCIYCFCESNPQKKKKLMTKSVAKKAIDFLFARPRQDYRIYFFGGEPLLNVKVLQFALEYSSKLAKRQSKRVTYAITTNATLLTQDVAELLKQYNVGVMVSLDGPKDVHNLQCPSIRDKNGSYDKACRGIGILQDNQIPFELRGTLTSFSPDISTLLDFYKKFPCTRLVLEPASNMAGHELPGDFSQKDYQSYEKQRTAIFARLSKDIIQKQTKFNPYAHILQDIKASITGGAVCRFRCQAGHSALAVSSTGEFTACARLNGIPECSMGNVDSGVNSASIVKFWTDYWKAIQPVCGKCWAWQFCKGPCPAANMNDDGSFQMHTRTCDMVRMEIEQAAYLFHQISKSNTTS